MNDPERLAASIKKVLEDTPDARDQAAVDEAHSADLAAALRQLPLNEQVALFRALPQERAGEVIGELDDATLLDLVRALEQMPPEHAADVVEELPSEHAEKILGLMQEDKSEEVQELLEYPEESAG